MLSDIDTLNETRTGELLRFIEVGQRELPGERKWLFDANEVKQLLQVNSRVNQLALDELVIPEKPQSNIRDHALRELAILVNQPSTPGGPVDILADYERAVHEGIRDLLEVFIAQGHSGMSAEWTLDIFTRLARFQALTPLTDNPADWREVHEGTWQSIRESECFSKDGGKTYYRVSTSKLPWWSRLIPRKLKMKLPDGSKLKIRSMFGKIYKSEPSFLRRSS